MWFDDIMDDSKKALKLANKNGTVFVPIIVNAAINILLAIFIVAGAIMLGIWFRDTIRGVFEGYESPWPLIIPVSIVTFLTYFIYTIIKAMMEVGSINMYKTAYEGVKPGAHHFFEGIKKYFWRVFGVTLLFNFIFVILSVPILLLFVFYTATIGILTAGWGLIFLWAVVGTYLSSWIIGRSIRLGKKYFWALFILNLAGIMIAQYVATVLGGFIALIGGWFLSQAIMLYMKFAIMLFYERKKGELFDGNIY
jgi:hypothetical protein